MDKDGFTKWVKQCREYAVELKIMEDVDYLSLSLYGDWSPEGGRDTAQTILRSDQKDIKIQFEGASTVILPVD